ncbi:F-box domain-containing protein [Psidium guajava]|nr:F-box domain-containing protein [Psidium guajava]
MPVSAKCDPKDTTTNQKKKKKIKLIDRFHRSAERATRLEIRQQIAANSFTKFSPVMAGREVATESK